MINLSNEISMNIMKEVIKVIPYFEVDIQQQIKLRNKIEEQLNDYEITSKCTDLSVCDILDKAFIFLACRKLEGMSDNTRYNYTLLFKRMAVFLNKPIAQITTIDLRLFLARAYPNNQANSLNTKISNIKAFFGWLQDEGYIIQNQTKNLQLVKEPYRKRSPIPEIDLERMKEACVTSRDKCIMEVILSSGIRVSEATNALISKIDWQENSLLVIGKGNKERKVFFITKARLFLINYIQERQDKGILSEYLFTVSKYPYAKLGQRSIERDIKEIASRAGVESNVFVHRLRTTYVCHGINNGISLTTMQKLCGHANPSTTLLYATTEEESVKHEYKKIAL